MNTRITKEGVLRIKAEHETEAFALTQWAVGSMRVRLIDNDPRDATVIKESDLAPSTMAENAVRELAATVERLDAEKREVVKHNDEMISTIDQLERAADQLKMDLVMVTDEKGRVENNWKAVQRELAIVTETRDKMQQDYNALGNRLAHAEQCRDINAAQLKDAENSWREERRKLTEERDEANSQFRGVVDKFEQERETWGKTIENVMREREEAKSMLAEARRHRCPHVDDWVELVKPLTNGYENHQNDLALTAKYQIECLGCVSSMLPIAGKMNPNDWVVGVTLKGKSNGMMYPHYYFEPTTPPHEITKQ